MKILIPDKCKIHNVSKNKKTRFLIYVNTQSMAPAWITCFYDGEIELKEKDTITNISGEFYIFLKSKRLQPILNINQLKKI